MTANGVRDVMVPSRENSGLRICGASVLGPSNNNAQDHGFAGLDFGNSAGTGWKIIPRGSRTWGFFPIESVAELPGL